MEIKRCTYCGKEIPKNESISVALDGENCADFCSADCFTKNARRNFKAMKFKSKKEMGSYVRKIQRKYRDAQFKQLLTKEKMTPQEAALLYQLLSTKDKRTLSIIGFGLLFSRNDGCTQKIMKEIEGK